MNDLIEMTKIGGPVTAISIVFLYYIDRMDKRTKILIENHLQHISEAINRNTQMLERLSVIINSFNKKKNRK